MPNPTISSSYHVRIYLLACLLLPLNFNYLQGELLHACKESEYHYEYTECDSKNTRWRVAVPHTPGLCTGLPDPVKGTDCSFSCSAGQYLDMEAQLCTPCIKGTYSLGTGVRFDEWTELPPGFTTISNNLYGTSTNCSISQWGARGEYVASNADECASTLMYSINLKQEGTVTFEYLYPDSSISFEFFVHNDQCQPMEEASRWMKTTDNAWSVHQVQLTKGTNVLYWKTTAFYIGGATPKPVLLRNIFITGAAYTSECFQCKPGTFAPSGGAGSCQICPRNTYSTRGASFCIQCEADKYSAPGSGSCLPRPPCTEKDYFYTHTPCDAYGETQLMYKWIEPKICSNSLEGAKQLPESGIKKKCPPCNPGFSMTNTSSCEPCPKDTFSNGTSCNPCPAGTQAMLGYEYKWWNTLPDNMQSLVMSGLTFEYHNESGWEVAGDYIYTSASSSDNDYMVLRLNIPSFSPPRRVTDDDSNEVAHITFVFDIKCTVSCQLFFMKAVNTEMSTLVESWTGSTEKQSYSYRVERNANITFTWAFQRTSTPSDEGRKYTADIAKIYSINVTNVEDGVASWCQPCAQDKDSQCISCPPGHYIDKKTSNCISCPTNTYLQSNLPSGEETCTQCGPGTKSNDAHSLCFNDCKMTISSGGNQLKYDFTFLSNVTTFTGKAPKFTSKGLKYFHRFSISLCGNQGKKLATCVQNVSDTWGSDMDLWRPVASYVCQTMYVPSGTPGQRGMMTSPPINLADQLIGVTTERTLDKISSPVDLFPGEHAAIKDIIFYYRSKEVTQSCTSGRFTTIRLRCKPKISGQENISVPSKCPEGTCDGCAFHFLWETEQACPLCTVNDYNIITSVCQHGIQRKTALWRKPQLCVGGVELPEPSISICKTEDFWLKVGVTGGICTALILTALAGYFWKKNRSLEYKYSRLMMNAPSKDDGELPAADSCAIMEGEDAEDELIFNNRHSILRKFIALSKKRTSDGFDSVPLKSSDGSHTDM